MKSKLLKKLIDNKLLNKMIFILSSSIATVIIILTYTLSYYYERISGEEIYKNTSSSINQASSTVQFLSESVNALLLQISNDSTISRLLQSERYSDMEIYKARRELDSIRYTNPKIHSIYIYDRYSQLIYESGETAQNYINNKDFFYDYSFVECLNNLDEYNRFSPILRNIPVIRPNSPESLAKVFTFFYYESNLKSNEVKHSIIAINISTSWMSEALGYFHGYNSDVNNIEIVNKNGQVVFSKENSNVGIEYENTNVLNKILSLKEDSGYFIDDSDQKKLVTYVKSKHIGYEDWIFISTSNYEDILKPIHDTRKTMYLISGIILLLSIISFVFMLKHFFDPIITQAMNKAKLLETEQQEKLKREAQRYLKQLLEGNIAEDSKLIRSNFERFNIDYDFSKENQLVLISVDDLNSIKRKYRDAYNVKLQEINEIIMNIYKKEFNNVININWQDGSVIAITTGSEEQILEQNKRMKDIFNVITDELNKKIQCCSISMSISRIGESIKDLPFLLSEVLEIQTYRYLYGYGKLLTADKIILRDQVNYTYPKEYEKDILTNLFGGKIEDTQIAYNKYVESLSCMSVAEIKISFLQLAYAIKYASKNTTIEATNSLINFEQFFTKIQSLETIDEVNHMFLNLFKELIDIIDAQLSAKYDDLIDYVKSQIIKDYGQVNLSIKEMAEKVDMSAAYLGRIFKQHTGIAFTEYLTKYRLEMACHELLNTNKTINEISDETGFTNSSYFYLVFKKYLECTPTQYKKSNLKEN
jgi:AraC-like DNA-binding protein